MSTVIIPNHTCDIDSTRGNEKGIEQMVSRVNRDAP